MAMTLAQMKEGMTDKVSQGIIDIFIRESQVLELLPFDNCVSPSYGSGSTLTYGYIRNKIPGQSAFRSINSNYTASEATVEKLSTECKIFGGDFEMDRVLYDAQGGYNNLAYQFEEKIKSTIGTFHNAMINGDATNGTGALSGSFNGLDVAVTGSTNELNTGSGSAIDLSTMANLKTNMDQFYELLQILITQTHADALFVSGPMKSKIQTVARLLGYKTDSEMAFGRLVDSIDGVRIIDLGNVTSVSGTTVTSSQIISNKTRAIGASNADVTGLSDIYAARLNVIDGFHGVTLSGTNGIKKYLPNFNDPTSATHKGGVEMVAAVALKNANNAGVLRNIKIA